jgi:hypothetical protein
VTRDLSEQFLVSGNTDWITCTGTVEEPGRRMVGCGGGFSDAAQKYHIGTLGRGETQVGAVYEADFPYTAEDQSIPQCSGSPYPKCDCYGYSFNNGNPPHTHHEKLCGWRSVPGSPSSIAAIKEAIYYAGPVSACVHAGAAFCDYDGGVFSQHEGESCTHAIVLVGWDDAQGIWYLRNSWGTGWGEDGYMRILYGISNVGYWANYVVYEGDPPSTSYDLDGTAGENGWYVSDVKVTLEAEDNPYGGGVELTQYELDGGGWQTYSVPFWVSDGRHTLSYRSKDTCGNWESPQSITLKIDTLPPSGSITLRQAAGL